jgi:hypothetical protein
MSILATLLNVEITIGPWQNPHVRWAVDAGAPHPGHSRLTTVWGMVGFLNSP